MRFERDDQRAGDRLLGGREKLTTESAAVATARAHVEAWSNHDYDMARQGLAADMRVTATATNLPLPETNLSGVDDSMGGLTAFAPGVVPGSARVVVSVGDERNGLLLLTIQPVIAGSSTRTPLRLGRLTIGRLLEVIELRRAPLPSCHAATPRRSAAAWGFSSRLGVWLHGAQMADDMHADKAFEDALAHASGFR